MKKGIWVACILFLILISPSLASPSITLHSPQNITYNIFAIPINVTSNETVNLTVYLKSQDFDGILTYSETFINDSDNSTYTKTYNLTAINVTSYFTHVYVHSGPVYLKVYAENENGSDEKEVWFTEFEHEIINVSTCGWLTSSNDYYILINDIVDTEEFVCFNIREDNITFDCGWHLVDGLKGGKSVGISSGKYNITIKNCIVKEFGTGIFLTSNEKFNITSSNVSDNLKEGIHLSTVNNSYLFNLTLTNNGYEGVLLEHSNYNNITNCTVENNGNSGIRDENVNPSFNLVENCIFRDNGRWGVESVGGVYMMYNTFENNGYGGVSLSTYSGGYIKNCTFNNSINLQVPSESWYYITLSYNYWGKPDGTGISDICADENVDGICDCPYVVNIYAGSATDNYPIAGTLGNPAYLMITFNYSQVNFGIVIPYNTYTLSGFFANISTNGNVSLYINGTNFSPSWSISTLNLTVYDDSYSKSSQFSTSRTYFDSFCFSKLHYHNFTLYVPLVEPKSYTTNITIDYVLS